MDPSKPDPPSRATIDRHLDAVFQPFAMLAGVRLGVFTVLQNGPLTLEDLAQAIEVGAFKLEPLLYGLVMAELLTVEDGRFANTGEAGHYLVQGRPGYMGLQIDRKARKWASDLKTAETIRTGIPQDKLDFAAASDEDLRGFFEREHAGALARGRLLAEAYGLCRFASLLDVAGGSGGLAIGACRSCPGLRARVVDLPRVTTITQDYLDAADLGGRVTVSALDVVEKAPEGRYDAAVMANLIQVLSRDQARRALANLATALQPRGTLFIIGWVLDDGQLSPPEIAASNFAFLNIYDEGRAFTEAAHRTWLTEAGFATFERDLLASGESVIRADTKSR